MRKLIYFRHHRPAPKRLTIQLQPISYYLALRDLGQAWEDGRKAPRDPWPYKRYRLAAIATGFICPEA